MEGKPTTDYPRLSSDNCSQEQVSRRFARQSDAEKRDRKVRRALSRLYAGFDVEPMKFDGNAAWRKKKGGDWKLTRTCSNYVLVTLTTPEGHAVDLNRAWRKFISRLARTGVSREYFAVREWNKRKTCEHIHAIFRASFIDAGVLRLHWKAAIGYTGRFASWVHIDRMYDQEKGIARYLTKYLVKGMDLHGEGRSFWYSYQWVFKRWTAYSYLVYKVGGIRDLPKARRWSIRGKLDEFVRLVVPWTIVQVKRAGFEPAVCTLTMKRVGQRFGLVLSRWLRLTQKARLNE